MKFLEDLAARRRFGMRPGLDAIRGACAALGNPQRGFRAIHVAGTNGKGAVCAILDAALRSAGLRIGRYTSPHLVKLNERFFLDGNPIDDATLEAASSRVSKSISRPDGPGSRKIPDLTFFEALTAVAYVVYSEARVDYAVLETGLGGRLDATNVCVPELCVVTRIGLDHCDWLGDTVERIASEKAGIIKPGVPVVLGENAPEARAVVEARAKALGSPFRYAPDIAGEDEIPECFPLAGAFNRENAVTAMAALKVMGRADCIGSGFGDVVWPGRFQRVGDFIVDGAHNPPAARALAEALKTICPPKTLALVAGFCGDKDVAEVLSVLAPFAKRGYAVRTNNPRSLSAEDTASRMREAGIDAVPCASLAEAVSLCAASSPPGRHGERPLHLICGSLFLAGEALVELGAYPWRSERFDPSETVKRQTS